MSQTRLRRHPLESLPTKLILFVFASTFATALVVSWVSLQSTYTHLRGAIDRRFPALLADTASQLEAALLAGRSECETLAADPALVRAARLAARGGRDATAAADALAARLEASGAFAGLALLPAHGAPVLAGGPSRALDRSALRRLARHEAPALDTAPGLAGALEVVATAPIRLDGERLGTAVGVFAAADLALPLGAHTPELGEAFRLVDAEGRVLAGAPAGGARAADRVPLAFLLRTRNGAIAEYNNDRDLRVIGGARAIAAGGWYVVIEAPFEQAFAPVLSIVSRIFVIDLCVILLFSFLAYRITAAVVQPIETLSDGARRIAQGQFDLEIPEPASHDELGLLTRVFNDMMRRIRRYQSEIENANRDLTDRNAELQQANEVLEQLSITDGLTRLHNHRFFQDHLTREIKRVSRTQEPLSMLLFDIDDFKKLNDRMGHATGDELLTRIARIMNASVRESDLLARYGGDEFVVLASDTDLQGACLLAEKIRTTIAEDSFILDDSLRLTKVTVSVGVALYRSNRKAFFQAADQALYRAKAHGKNCVVVEDELPAPKLDS